MQEGIDAGFAFLISWGYNGRRSCADVCASFCAALRKERVPAAAVRVSSYWRPSPGEPPEGQGRALSAVVLRASEAGEEEQWTVTGRFWSSGRDDTSR